MQHTANVSRQWVIRILIVGIVFIGFGGWAIYDGLIYYPRRNHIIETYLEHQETGRLGEWQRLAEEKGWPEEPDEDDYKTEWDIRTQFIMAALCLPFGLLLMLRLGLKSRQSLAADDQAFTAAGGARIPYSAITRIDKRRWNSKGIADIYYCDQNNRERKERVDAWIFKGGDEILKAIEKATGLTDPEYDSESEAEENEDKTDESSTENSGKRGDDE